MNTNYPPVNSTANFQPVVSIISSDTSGIADCFQSPDPTEKEFDAYAAQYESALSQGLSVSGEGPEYFARKRIEWTAKILPRLGTDSVETILDFGCGVGIATPILQNELHPSVIWGFDPSTSAIERASLEFASQEMASQSTQFTYSTKNIPANFFDLAYCNGVFHHIEPNDRPAAFETVFRSLRPGGWFAFWENNPWNPGTRYVMSKIPFDRDAVVISPWEAKRILKSAGFVVARFDAWFLFPRSLSWLRPIESLFHRWPLGAQYLVLAQKPKA